MERNLLKIRWKISVVTSDLLIKQQMPLNLFHFWETGTTIFSSGRLRGIFLFGPKTSEGQGGTKSVQKNLCNGYDHGGDGGGDDDHHCWLRTPPWCDFVRWEYAGRPWWWRWWWWPWWWLWSSVLVFEVHPPLMQSDLWPNAGQETEHQPLSTASSSFFWHQIKTVTFKDWIQIILAASTNHYQLHPPCAQYHIFIYSI